MNCPKVDEAVLAALGPAKVKELVNRLLEQLNQYAILVRSENEKRKKSNPDSEVLPGKSVVDASSVTNGAQQGSNSDLPRFEVGQVEDEFPSVPDERRREKNFITYLHNECAQKDSEIAKLNFQIHELNEDKKKQAETISLQAESISSLEKQLATLRDECDELRTGVHNREIDPAAYKQSMTSQPMPAADVLADNARLRTKVDALNLKIKELTASHTALTNQLATPRRRQIDPDLAAQTEEYRIMLEKSAEIVQNRSKEIDHLRHQINLSQERLASAEAAKNKYKEMHEQLMTKHDLLALKCEELKREQEIDQIRRRHAQSMPATQAGADLRQRPGSWSHVRPGASSYQPGIARQFHNNRQCPCCMAIMPDQDSMEVHLKDCLPEEP